jgi:hypothetical protein
MARVTLCNELVSASADLKRGRQPTASRDHPARAVTVHGSSVYHEPSRALLKASGDAASP